LSPEIVASVRRCVSRFNVEHVDVTELLPLGQAELAANQDSLADQAFRRAIAPERNLDGAERAWTLARIVTFYANAAPSRIERAEEYMSRLDALGDAAAAERLLARRTLAAVAAAADSVPMLITETDRAVVAAAQMRGDWRKQRALDEAAARVSRADAFARRAMPDSAVAVLNRAVAELVPLRPTVEPQFRRTLSLYELLGQPATRVKGTQWYAASSNAQFPVPAQVTMIYFGSHGCLEYCYPGYAVLRRLRQRIDTAKVHLVVVAATYGFFRNRIVGVHEEMDSAYAYLRDRIGAPVPTAIWQTEAIPRSDGLLVRTSSPMDSAYASVFNIPGNNRPLLLVDRRGRIRLVVSPSQLTEARLTDVLAELTQ